MGQMNLGPASMYRDAPAKMRTKTCRADIITTERNDPSIIESVRTIDLADGSARIWLSKHMSWAVSNGFAVHVASSAEK